MFILCIYALKIVSSFWREKYEKFNLITFNEFSTKSLGHLMHRQPRSVP